MKQQELFMFLSLLSLASVESNDMTTYILIKNMLAAHTH